MRDDNFVEREFKCDDQLVIARFGKPALAPGGEYVCRWSLHWPDRERRSHACGIDGIQALILAMRTVHTELTLSDEYQAGRLTYLDERELDLPPAWTFDEDAHPDT